MSAAALHRSLALLELALAVPTFLALRRVTAPYGRHARKGWGPALPARVGWLVMESPAPVLFAAFYALGEHRAEPAPLAFLALWELHYLNRAFLDPLRMRGARAPMPVAVAAMAVLFNVLNAYVNGRWVSGLGSYPAAWLRGGRFLLGAATFLAGLAVNVRADAALRALRREGEGDYRIPRGGLFERVSCPNYLGEVLEWTGWAVATWSLAGLAFALYTAANLAPRALSHHAWYRARFPDYPRDRRALVPYLL